MSIAGSTLVPFNGKNAPNPLAGQAQPQIIPYTVPGQAGAGAAFAEGQWYNVYPIRLTNGQYTMAGAPATMVSS
jgi:hypothetical protein